MRKVIAIDFDGCLCSSAYPNIGKPHWEVIRDALAEKAKGSALILWTCREGDLLQEAVKACESWGLSFDAINENLSERVSFFGTNSRKISADEYWDDRAVHIPEHPPISDFPQNWRVQLFNKFTRSEKSERIKSGEMRK